MSSPVGEHDLHAFVDGELDDERRRRIEDHLQTSPDDAALVETWRRQNAALRAAFAHAAKEPLPLSLKAAAARAGATAAPGASPVNWSRFSPSKAAALRAMRRLDAAAPESRRRPALAFAAALLIAALAAGGAVLAFLRSAPPKEERVERFVSPGGFAARATAAYATFAPDSRPVEIGADKAAELSAWLAERAGFGAAPDLRPLLKLVGGRIVPGVDGPAGFLLYETQDGVRAGLYFERAAGPPPMAEPPKAPADFALLEWRAAGMAFVLLGPLRAEAAQQAAAQAARQIGR